jgi:hypothetical protein
MDRAIVRAPSPICIALTQPGDFSEDIVLYIIFCFDHDIKVLKNLIWKNLLPIDLCYEIVNRDMWLLLAYIFLRELSMRTSKGKAYELISVQFTCRRLGLVSHS